MNCEHFINKQKHQIDKKVRRRDHSFSTRLTYANKKIVEIWMNMVNTTYNSKEDMINKLQRLKGKTKLKTYKNLSNYYDNMDVKMDEDPFAKNAQGIVKIYHEVLLVMIFLQTEPQIRNMNIKYYDLSYTVIKKRDKESVNEKNEKIDNDYTNFNDNIPNHYAGRKNDNVMLR